MSLPYPGRGFRTLPKRDKLTQLEDQIKQLVAAREQLMTLVCAMVKHPDALTVDEDGQTWLDLVALDHLKEGTRLQVQKAKDSTKFKLSVEVGEVPRIATPKVTLV